MGKCKYKPGDLVEINLTWIRFPAYILAYEDNKYLCIRINYYNDNGNQYFFTQVARYSTRYLHPLENLQPENYWYNSTSQKTVRGVILGYKQSPDKDFSKLLATIRKDLSRKQHKTYLTSQSKGFCVPSFEELKQASATGERIYV